MGLFEDKKSKEKIEYLEDERKKLWGRLTQLEKDNKELQALIERKTTDDEKEAAQSSKKTTEYRNRAKERLEEANKSVALIDNQLVLATDKLDAIKGLEGDISYIKTVIDEIKADITLKKSDILESVGTLEEKIEIFNEFFQSYPDLTVQLGEVDDAIIKINDNVGKSNISLTAVNKKKQEIDDIHQEVFGYTEEDEDGKETFVEGLKGRLENSYSELEEKIESSIEEIKVLSEKSHKGYADFHKSHKEKYESINKEIESLLPAAMTAGLSSAFSSKKEDEVASSRYLERRFGIGIYLLIGVSMLPIIVSIYFLYNQVPLNEVINRLPRLVLAIVPMYIPVLWFTYSANKKLNLSKRLIEEYAHKEVLSKTYEGLSKQIAGLNNDEQSLELKYRLLSNFLQVTSENPGKLISNYEASDHPVMEALEQSYKFQIALDKLGNIPGIGKIAAILENKAKDKVDRKGKTIEGAFSKGDSFDPD